MKIKDNFIETTENIYQWFDDKNLSDPIMQFAKTIEEIGEIAHELTRGHYDTPEMLDALGDTYVTLVGMAHHLGYDIAECAEAAYNVINNRTGKVVNGSFVKDV